MGQSPFFTVFIPTYNRGYCIENTVLSCNHSTFRDFEVVLIDDGSSDNTAEVIHALADKVTFPLRYLYQVNQGKHVAFNHAVLEARGYLFLTLDSDDTLLPGALDELHSLWTSLDAAQKQVFASIEFRCLENGVASSAYPEPYLDSTYVEHRLVCGSQGEKRSAYRTEVLREYPYPVFAGERYCRPGLIDIRIAQKYKTRFSNIVAIDAGHFADGIGANRRRIIVSAPRAYRQYFLEEITDHVAFNSDKDLRSFYKRYCRCSLNAGISVRQMLDEVPRKWLLWLVLPEAWVGSVADGWMRRRLQRRSG